jgi:hypothetical protein
MLFRCLRSIILFAVLYFYLRYLGVDKDASLIVSLIPFVLAFLNILTAPAFGIAALVFICAALSALLPAEYSNAADFMHKKPGHVSMDTVHDTLLSEGESGAKVRPTRGVFC